MIKLVIIIVLQQWGEHRKFTNAHDLIRFLFLRGVVFGLPILRFANGFQSSASFEISLFLHRMWPIHFHFWRLIMILIFYCWFGTKWRNFALLSRSHALFLFVLNFTSSLKFRKLAELCSGHRHLCYFATEVTLYLLYNFSVKK